MLGRGRCQPRSHRWSPPAELPFESAFSGWRALLALIVGVSLQVGVNYANDYSDGIRGTDAVRIGPLRLVGSGLARPRTVKAAAFALSRWPG